MEAVRILLDVDTGIDDSLAILLALKSNNAVVEGITTVFGNTDVEQATRNTLQVIELADAPYEVPVAAGASGPLFGKWGGPVVHVHGENGIGNCELPWPKQKPLEEKAADFIVRKVNENPGQLTLVFVGPLTNLAIALVKDPSIASKVKRLVLMGGAVTVPGNVTPVVEANMHSDPEAAHRVFESGMPITMVGLDATMRTIIDESHLERLSAGSDSARRPQFIGGILSYYFNAYLQQDGFYGAPLHDPLAVAAALDPTLVQTKDLYIRVETKGELSYGATVAEFRRPPERTNASVCMDVDSGRFLETFMNVLSQ